MTPHVNGLPIQNIPSAYWAIPGIKPLEEIKEITQPYNPDQIISVACQYYNITVDDIKRKTRKREIALARQVCIYLIKSYTSLTLKSIGQLFGGKDHTTVMHSIRAVKDQLTAKFDNPIKVDVPVLVKIISTRRPSFKH